MIDSIFNFHRFHLSILQARAASGKQGTLCKAGAIKNDLPRLVAQHLCGAVDQTNNWASLQVDLVQAKINRYLTSNLFRVQGSIVTRKVSSVLSRANFKLLILLANKH